MGGGYHHYPTSFPTDRLDRFKDLNCNNNSQSWWLFDDLKLEMFYPNYISMYPFWFLFANLINHYGKFFIRARISLIIHNVRMSINLHKHVVWMRYRISFYAQKWKIVMQKTIKFTYCFIMTLLLQKAKLLYNQGWSVCRFDCLFGTILHKHYFNLREKMLNVALLIFN